MRYFKVLLTILLSIQTISCIAQQYSYTHYDEKDGLAGSTVYDIAIDKDGYIWFATETGVSRFDGTHFKNFRTQEGLPDNEIIRIYADSRGRVWMAPFKKSICYYYKGKIYNQQNSSFLNKLNLQKECFDISEDHSGTIYLINRSMLWAIRNDSSIVDLANDTSIGEVSGTMKGCVDKLDVLVPGKRGKNYLLENAKFQVIKDRIPGTPYVFRNNHIIPMHKRLTSFINAAIYVNVLGDDREFYISVCSSDGVYLFRNLDSVPIGHFVPGQRVSRALIDDEKNFWFSTLGKGVFRLNSIGMISYRSFLNDAPTGVFSLAGYNGGMFIGTNQRSLLHADSTGKISKIDLDPYLRRTQLISTTGNLKTSILKITPEKQLLIGNDAMLLLYDIKTGGMRTNSSAPIKTITENQSYYLLSTATNILRIDKKDLATKDTIYNSRATALHFKNDSLYIGTQDGLLLMRENKNITDLGIRYPALKCRVAAIEEDANGMIWVATYSNGLLALKNGRLIKRISMENGLSSNICRNIFIQKNSIWAGTEKGLNKITFTDTGYNITKYSTQDGLNSNIINCSFASNQKIYVGTQEGLNIFDESKISQQSQCRMILETVRADNMIISGSDNISLRYNNNNLFFEYVAISYKSNADITYYYRLKGLYDDKWQVSKQTFVNFTSLPYGDYTFEIYAINKFGKRSEPIAFSFHISKPFWETWWFIILTGLSLVILTSVVVIWTLREKSRKKQEAANIIKRMSEMEQVAMRAQMNPHFIFNCLNSIQHFIIRKDVEKSNMYLTQFASIIRQTLDNSAKNNISINDEVRYLRSYLDLEKMRFRDKFNYNITVDPSIREDYTMIPCMILQPFVENSIRHGMRYRKENGGLIEISFQLQSNNLVCKVKDNGIGRKKAEEYKSGRHIEYQSKGIQLTRDRLELLSKQYGIAVEFVINDLVDDGNEGIGTEIVIHFPLNLIKQLN